MSEVLLFDCYGASVPSGAAPIDTIDLRLWPGCRMIFEQWPSEIEFVIFVSDDTTDLPSQMLSQVVLALEGGAAVVVHARSDELACEVSGKIMGWLGGALN